MKLKLDVTHGPRGAVVGVLTGGMTKTGELQHEAHEDHEPDRG
jgi:hypothetical protein